MNHDIFFVGFAVSMLFHELTGLYPGGIVVPAFLALHAGQPFRIAGTLTTASLGFLLYRLLSRHIIAFGSRRFFLTVSLSALIVMGAAEFLPALLPGAPDARAVGIVVPGLLANSCERQGYATTMAATGIATALVFLAARLLALL